MLKTKEFYDLMNAFEKSMDFVGYKKENKESWISGYYYCNGEINKFFKAYMHGYQNAKCLARLGEFE